MISYVRVTVNTRDLVDIVPAEMVGQAMPSYARFVQQKYLEQLEGIPGVVVMVSARRRVPHAALGNPATVRRINYRLSRMRPENFPREFVDEAVRKGREMLSAEGFYNDIDPE